MKVRESSEGSVVTLQVADEALFMPPVWDEISALAGSGNVSGEPPDGARLFVLDLEGVEFISGIFLESCVELAGTLAGRGHRLAVLGLGPALRDLLAAIEGGSRLTVLSSQTELRERAPFLIPSSGGFHGQVRSAEKNVLWS